MSPTILPSLDLEHLERPRLVAVALLGRLVLAECRRAVRRLDRDDARPAAAVPRPNPPGEDVVAPGEPEVERRHRLRRVLLDERREGLHVVALERRRRSARRSSAIGRLDGGRRGRRESLASSVARARCSALFTEATRRLEELGDLRRLPAQHLAEDQHRALARRQLLQRGDEGEANGLAPGHDVGRVPLGHDEAVGHRLDPELIRRAEVLDDRRARRPEIHRQRTSLAAVEQIEADVRRDAVEPRAKRGAALEAVDSAPRANEASPGRRPPPRLEPSIR